jgi:dihydrofolate reductase
LQKLIVFNNVSLDGYFTDKNGDMSWAYNPVQDGEWDAFVASNAKSGGTLLFGRITYDLMVNYWPTPAAKKNNPAVAEGMNRSQKVVVSKSLSKPTWENTRLIKGDLAAEIRKLKQEAGEGIAILGSGSIVAQLAPEGLIDEYQIVVTPVVLGKGRTLFDGIEKKLMLKQIKTRAFKNGNVVLYYEPQQ